MRNFGAAGPVLKSAPLLAHPRAAPFGRVRLTDAHDAPLSDEFDHLVCPLGGRGSARAVSFVGVHPRDDFGRGGRKQTHRRYRGDDPRMGDAEGMGKGKSGWRTRCLALFVVVSWSFRQNAELLRDIYADGFVL